MSTFSPQSAAMLGLLVAESRAAEVGFRQAATAIDDDRLQTLLSNFAQLRAQLAGELERALATIHPFGPSRNGNHSEPEFPQDTSSGPTRQGGSTLAECHHHDEQLLKQYQWVLKRDLPPALRQIVSRQHAAVYADHQRLSELFDPNEIHSPADAHTNASSKRG